MHDVSAEDRKRALGADDARALRDLALVELVTAGGLRLADARLLELTDLRLDREGAPVGIALARGDADLPVTTAAVLGEWLPARAEVLPVGRMLLPELGPEHEGRAGTRRDTPLARAEAERVVAAALAAAGRPPSVDPAPSDLGILARAPAAWCESCGARWYSQIMVDGLAALDGCPRCSGELRMRPERATAERQLLVPVGGEPQHVLGAPRPTRRAVG
jgi:hypothetical protein